MMRPLNIDFVTAPDSPVGFGIHQRTRCQRHTVQLPDHDPVIHCSWHNPSDHHMVTWPRHIRLDRRDQLTERICPHGIGHPDPDCVAFLVSMGYDRETIEIHSCDGCCDGP